MNHLTLFLAAAAVVPTYRAYAQSPREARELVVRVASHWGARPEGGAGIIVGMDQERVSIITAGHVVRRFGPGAQVWVSFPDREKDSVQAILSDSARTDVDLAVLTVPRAALPRSPALNRLGNVRKLGFNDAVSPMGCPRGVCWAVPAPPDRFVSIDGPEITFQSLFVNAGSSGGALFNQYWEVVGMVTQDQPPRAKAMPIDEALDLVRAWKYPVSLRRAKVPREGYALHVGASVMTRLGTTDEPLGAENRFPSGRVVASRRGELYGLTWHLSALRLAPRNLAVMAAMGGLGVAFNYGRFTAQPFLEVGMGQVEGRYDAGGYYLSGAGGPTYVPFWRQEKQDGLGLGAGLSVLATVLPHVTLEIMGGHWSFNVPDSLPSLPNFFVGTGLRWGL